MTCTWPRCVRWPQRLAFGWLQMDSEKDKIIASAAYVVMSYEFLKMKKLSKRKRRWWMVSVNKSRTNSCNASDMLSDLQQQPSGRSENLCRLSATDFEYLLNKIAPIIQKTDTNMREAIPVQERFAVTLRFLASGDSFRSLSVLFKFSVQTVSRCIFDVCSALIHVLRDEIKMPMTSQEWLQIAQEFDEKCNFPHCVGALDGKHILIQYPTHSGSEFSNYKGTFSVVLMALVDANHRFIFVDVGCQGRINDSDIFRNATLFKKLNENKLMFPPDQPLPSKELPVPYVFVGDNAFTLSSHVMTSYPGTYDKGSLNGVFNYHVARVHRVVENVYGIMACVFRVFRKPMLLEPDKVSNITMTCVLLHNFLRSSKTSSSRYLPLGIFDIEKEGEVIPGSWRQDQKDLSSFLPLRKMPGKPEFAANKIREAFADFFATNGTVP